MPAGFEIIENPVSTSPMGSFAPRADQTKYRSVFACTGGEKQAGWQDSYSVKNGIPTQDGKARLVYSEYSDPVTKKAHAFRWGKMDIQEYVVPIDQAIEKEKYDAALSADKVVQYLAARGTSKENGDLRTNVLEARQENITLAPQ
jgi:hypothetical protein